jgi:nitroreductase
MTHAMTTFYELAKKRYSVRKFLDRQVEEEKLNYILETGRIAPSAANFQPWHIIVIRSKETIRALGDSYPRPWFLQAPVVLVFCGDHKTGWKRADGKDHTDIDISIIVDHITLAAAEQGLGTCWICNFDLVKCRQVLELPDAIEPIVILPLGYPEETGVDHSRHLARKKLDDIVHWEKF